MKAGVATRPCAEMDQARAGIAVAGLDLEPEPVRVLSHRPSLWSGAQALARHRLGLRDVEQVEGGRSDVGEDAAVAQLDGPRR